MPSRSARRFKPNALERFLYRKFPGSRPKGAAIRNRKRKQVRSYRWF